MLELKIQRLCEEAIIPRFAHEGDAGMDLYSIKEYSLKPGERTCAQTGIKIAIPRGYAGIIKPKSGLALNHGVDIMAGVIDSGYRGEIGVVMINLGHKELKVDKSQKIAQMIFYQVHHPSIKEVSSLDETSRGEGGFGSTGVK